MSAMQMFFAFLTIATVSSLILVVMIQPHYSACQLISGSEWQMDSHTHKHKG